VTRDVTPSSPAADAATRARIDAVRRAIFTLACGVLLVVAVLVGLDVWSFIALELALVAGLVASARVPSARAPCRAPRDPLSAALAALERDGWRRVDRVALTSGTVDHVLIGPPGAFALVTATVQPGGAEHVDELLLRRVHRQAMTLEPVIGHRVVPVVVLRGAAPPDVPGGTRSGVVVVDAGEVATKLRSRPTTTSIAGVRELHARLVARLAAPVHAAG
jgi:hypothetical protein